MELQGRTAIITGAASGIGRALAFEAARRGMSVALLDSADLGPVAEALAGGGSAPFTAQVDVRDSEAVAAFGRAVLERFADIAALFVNAGVLRAGPLAEQSVETWRLMVDVNLMGSLTTIGAFLPALIARDRPARIVLTGSQSSLIARPDVCVYSATKHALWAIAEGLKFELDRAGAPIGVSLVAPGAVATGLAGEETAEMSAGQQYLRRALAEHGADPAALASLMFDAVAAGRFWILPAPETKGQLAARLRRVLDEEEPQP